VTFEARRLLQPSTTEQLRAAVQGAERIRPLGTGHSFSTVADCDDTQLDLSRMPVDVSVDRDAATVTTSGWITWGRLAAEVDRYGLALANMGSLPHISVAGAIATGTHGSGSALTCLAGSVRSLTVVDTAGEVRHVDRDREPHFPGMVVALGRLGVVTDVGLDLVPRYEIRQTVWVGLRLHDFLDGFDEVMDSARSVSAFVTFQDDVVDQVWCKSDAGRAADLSWSGAQPASTPLHPVPGMDPSACTEQLSVAGPWHARMPHFRMEHTPSSGRELQSEYLVAREHAAAAVSALHALRDTIRPLVQVAEIRTVRADDLWLSPAYERDSVALHVTWVDDAPAVTALLSLIEAALRPFEPRPHWGKVFTMTPDEVLPRYPRASDFSALVREWDPSRRFANAFTDGFFRS
jgi:xylitol oxidase